jgi:hypothetical protein
MPRFVWVIRAFSPRDGGWVRMLGLRPQGHYNSEEMAWKCVCAFWDLMVMSGDYLTIDVVKTIAF